MASYRRVTGKRSSDTEDGIPELAAPPLRVAAFNIQIFGQKKMKNKNATAIIIKIIHRYDLILIQEIRDRAKTSLDDLLAVLNKVDPEDPFKSEVSERLGRSNSKEQYAFLYRPSRLRVAEIYQFDDGVDDGTDAFEREPYAIRFKSPDLVTDDFVVIAIHTCPTKAVAEINALLHVWEATKQHFGIEDIIIAGDFNADGDFVSGSDWEKIALRSDRRFSWLINDNADTTVGSTDCSYDRFVVTGRRLKNSIVPGSTKVFKFDAEFALTSDQAHEVSDHYPIELCMEGKRNTKVQKVLSTELSVVIKQLQHIPSVKYARAVYRASKTTLRGFRPTIVRCGVRKSMLEVTAVRNETTDVVESLMDFHRSFPEVLRLESVSMARAYIDSGMFDSPPYVYALCTADARKSYDVNVTCRLKEPLTCNITIKKRRS